MMSLLTGKKILLGITGGIAAYKVAEWVRGLGREGAEVTVVQTESATRFITPLTLTALSGRQVHTDMFATNTRQGISHIDLIKTCDVLIIAPATANTISKLAQGIADNLLTTLALAATCPLIVFPAMNSNMYLHPATQTNLDQLRQYNYLIVEPESGKMACGTEGPGRLPAWPTAHEHIAAAFCQKDLQGIKFLITAGPTQEDLDPVRFLSNRSSGKMGYALAKAAWQRGASVVLVSGPVNLPPPPGITTIKVRSAQEMYNAVHEQAVNAQVIIKAAAVSDYRPLLQEEHKIKKGPANFDLQLTANKDILKSLGESKAEKDLPILIGFAAESESHIHAGLQKLNAKNLDLIIINDIKGKHTGFAVDTNQVTIINREGQSEPLPLASKNKTARLIMDRVANLVFQSQLR